MERNWQTVSTGAGVSFVIGGLSVMGTWWATAEGKDSGVSLFHPVFIGAAVLFGLGVYLLLTLVIPCLPMFGKITSAAVTIEPFTTTNAMDLPMWDPVLRVEVTNLGPEGEFAATAEWCDESGLPILHHETWDLRWSNSQTALTTLQAGRGRDSLVIGGTSDDGAVTSRSVTEGATVHTKEPLVDGSTVLVSVVRVGHGLPPERKLFGFVPADVYGVALRSRGEGEVGVDA